MIIVIDGPAGTGKSTVARKLAKRCGYTYFNTGAMYRAMTLQCIRQGVSLEDADALDKALENFSFRVDPGEQYFLGAENGEKIYYLLGTSPDLKSQMDSRPLAQILETE